MNQLKATTSIKTLINIFFFRFSVPDSSVELARELPREESRVVKTPQMKTKKLSNQRPPIGTNNILGSPKLVLKKSKSDVSRLRSKSSVEGCKTMAEKIRDQRLK